MPGGNDAFRITVGFYPNVNGSPQPQWVTPSQWFFVQRVHEVQSVIDLFVLFYQSGSPDHEVLIKES